jgi:transposase
MLLADWGYDADGIRALAAEKGVWVNIPPRCDRNEPIGFSPYLYRARNLVERCFNKIKQCRRVATRLPSFSSHQLGYGYSLMSPRRDNFVMYYRRQQAAAGSSAGVTSWTSFLSAASIARMQREKSSRTVER